MFYDGDIDTFFDAFAEDVTYAESGSAGTSTIDGIFDSAGSIVTIGKATMVIEKPQVLIKSSDVPNLSADDTFTHNGTTYKVVHWTDDGTGMTTVILAENKR